MAHTTKKKNNQKEEKQLTPVVVYFWIVGLAFLFYLLARFILWSYPHPYHWMAAILGGVLGYPWGWVWYRWRGDII